ncbi:MAG: hemerythrin domain-containing protein [Archangium sp.]|nr:hemerythrin domain-containing protein [Archangium sp.]
MDALVWSDRFLTGLATVDAQHERLVELINAFGELNARTSEVPRAELEAVVDELTRYAHTHFFDEEALMRAGGVDPRFVSQHVAQHAHFLRDVGQMRASDFLGRPETARVLLRFLLHWLAFHILGTDMQLARQLELLRLGETAEAAYAAEVREVEGPAQLLLGALDDLLRVIAVRNAELTEANRTLEARVAERTAELQASIDALRSTQMKLVESEKLASVGQLASGMAHEINNPLAYITGNLTALEDHTAALFKVLDAEQALEPELPEPARARLEQVRRQVDLAFVREDLAPLLAQTREGVGRVQTIVRDLKDFSHVDSATLTDVDLKSCVEATLKVVGSRHREGVTFETSFGAAPRLHCQAAQVNHALLSLVLNAAQAVRDTPGGRGAVAIRTGLDGAFAFVEVKDTGVGMAPEVLSRAFEPFFTTRAPGQGVGLGLSTTYNCARAHGGRVDAASEPGVGSTFRLSLPIDGHEDLPAPSLRNDFNGRRYA